MKAKAPVIKGLAVRDIDGAKVGEIVDFYFDARTNEPEWLVLQGGVLGHRAVLIPLDDIKREDGGLRTPYPKEMILHSPHVEAPSIDKQTERALYKFYDVRRELPGRSTGRPAYKQNGSKTGDYRLRSWRAWKAVA